MHVDWSLRAVDVITVVEAAMARYGVPKHLRSDNGPEFIAYAIQDWLKSKNVKTIYITPGSPWENAYIESFHDKLRDECLNREIFGSLWEARVVIEQWRLYYNAERPHSSLGYQTPAEFAGRAISRLGFRRATPSLRPERLKFLSNRWQNSTYELEKFQSLGSGQKVCRNRQNQSVCIPYWNSRFTCPEFF